MVVSILLRALCGRGFRVQAFKIGPDFIDTAYHTEATGRASINLDLWMMGAEGVIQSFHSFAADADVSVIEAMGGLFDGTAETDAAYLAKLLRVPVIVVLDVHGMTRTTGAILGGLRAFDPDLDIAGCVLNRTGSSTHRQMILDSLQPELRRLVIGTIPDQPVLAIPERHLGLLTVTENPASYAERNLAQRAAAADVDIERLLAAASRYDATGARGARSAVGGGGPARNIPPLNDRRTAAPNPTVAPRPGCAPKPGAPVAASHLGTGGVRLAVARDPAFCFYYAENLRILQVAGFELVPFRPTSDPRLPPGTDAVYIGGGYPESFAADLAANQRLAGELRERAAAGMPIYAECGGLMYLAASLTGYDGTRHAMTGLLSLDVVMDSAHLAIRYVEVITQLGSPLGPPGTRLRGQEFHQSRVAAPSTEPNLFATTTSDGTTSVDGYLAGSVVASYVHVHLASNPSVARNFLAAATAARAGHHGPGQTEPPDPRHTPRTRSAAS